MESYWSTMDALEELASTERFPVDILRCRFFDKLASPNGMFGYPARRYKGKVHKFNKLVRSLLLRWHHGLLFRLLTSMLLTFKLIVASTSMYWLWWHFVLILSRAWLSLHWIGTRMIVRSLFARSILLCWACPFTIWLMFISNTATSLLDGN